MSNTEQKNDFLNVNKLDSNQIRELVDHGGSILCINVPIKIKFGIDYMTFEIGNKFKGGM